MASENKEVERVNGWKDETIRLISCSSSKLLVMSRCMVVLSTVNVFASDRHGITHKNGMLLGDGRQVGKNFFYLRLHV